MSAVPAKTSESIDEHVARLLRRWREEAACLSSSTAMVAQPAYQELIALGATALPPLFRDLEQTGDGHLSMALTAITGAHPIPPEERGRIRQIAQTWLRWAREHGYQW